MGNKKFLIVPLICFPVFCYNIGMKRFTRWYSRGKNVPKGHLNHAIRRARAEAIRSARRSGGAKLVYTKMYR